MGWKDGLGASYDRALFVSAASDPSTPANLHTQTSNTPCPRHGWKADIPKLNS